MNKYVAVRAKTLTEAKNALDKSGCAVIKSRAERSDPAFRNLVEGFHARGMVYDINGCGVFWLLIEDDRTLETWQAFSAVECVFTEGWFVEQAQKVRYLKGIAYCDATSAWADLYPLKNQARKIQVQFDAPDEFMEPITPEVCVRDEEKTEALKAEQQPRTTEVQVLSLDLDGDTQVKPVVKKTQTKSKRKRRRVIKEEQLDMFTLSQASLLQ